MVSLEDIPQHWINKAGIAKRIGVSRVTVDRVLKKVQKDKALSSRLTIKKVKQGLRTGYWFDPSDIDAVFAEVQKAKRPNSSNVHKTNSHSASKVNEQTTELLAKDLEIRNQKIESLQKEVSRLEQNNEDLRNSMRLITDQTKRSWWNKITGN